MDQKEFDAILKSHKHAEESPGDIAERIIGMGQPKRTIGGTLKDIGVTSVNAAIGAGEAVVGLADLATGGMAGKGLSQLGYDPKAARNFLQQYKSEAQQAADRRVDEAKGFGGTLKAYLRNPSTIVEAGAESLPSMFLGGGIGRGIGAAGKAAGILSNPAARAGLLGAIGEGVVGAGSAAEQIRQETGELTGKGAASAIGSGVGTGVLGRLGNKLAPKLGAVDIEEALVRGFSGNARNVPLSFGKTLKAITGGAISEGAFEELPQSIQEQVWQNYATGKPLMEGVPEGAAQGLVTGAAMGGAVNIHSALPGQQRKALAELEQKRQAELAQEHDKLVREATRGQVVLQAATGQNLPGVSSAGLNFDGGSGLPPGVAPYMAGQNASTFDLMREQQQRQAQTALDLEQRQQAAREQVLQQERIQNQLAANGFGYAPGQSAAVHGAPDEMASALAGETEEEYQQRLGNLEHRRQQGQQGLINVLQNRVDMQRQNAQATAGAIAKAAQAAKQQENEQAQRDRFDQWAAAERAAGRDVGPFSMDEQQQAKATSSGPLGKAVAKGFGALNEAERAVEYGRIFDRGATNTQAIEQIQADRERAFLGDGESSDAVFPEFRQELAANRRERVAQGLPATLTPDAKAAATIEGVGFRQQPGSKLPPELDYQVSRMEAQLQESITGTHEANVDQNGDTVWLKGKGYWPQWMEKKTMPRGKWAKQGTQEREDQAEDLKNANILHDAGRDKILAVIDKARKGVALGSHEKSIWSAVERIASQPGGPALWGQSDMLIADANEAAANERMQSRYGLSMLPKPMTVRVADIEPGETLAVDGMVEDAVGKTVLYTHKGIDAQGNTIMERGEHDAVTGKTGAARVMRFEPTDHLEGVIGVRERADREQNPNRTTKAYNREGKAFRSIEKQGIAITEPQNIPVDMLRPGDRVVIRDPQGMPDVATMRGYDSNNRAVIRDGIEYHLQADDNITVEGFRAKGEVRQTKGFGYRPKNERQQIAREYEQDRQERAERSEILREAKTQVRGELTNTLRQIADKRRIHAEEQRALATQANRRQQAGADSKQGTPQAVMPKGSRPTASLGYGFHPGDNTPTLERARAQKQEQKENRKTFPGTQYETGEQRVRENRRNFPATKYETGKPGRIEREAFARPTGYQQVKPATDVERENKRQSGLARQQEGEARPQGIIRGGTDNDRALAHEQYQAVLDFAAGKLQRENAGLSTQEARRQAVQQLGLEEKAVPETGWWRERAGKSPGYLANLLSKSAAKRTKTHVEHSSGSNPYFLSTEKSTIVPLKDLLSSEPKLDAARVDRARANMDAAAAGTGAKRKPLPVYRRSDGKLVALDGNSTLAVLRERGEKSAIVEIKKTIKQPRATLDEIYADAAKADVVLRKSLADFVERTGGRLVSRPDGQIKSRERAEQKARQDSTPRKLKDIVAHTLVYPDQKNLMQALPQFEKEYGPIELKNRFENPPDSGYRDILANVRVKEADGHIAEIQLTTKAMLQAKEGLGHKIYEVQRELDDIAKRTSNAEATELALEFDKISKEYYEAAAQSSSSSKSATASSSALFRLTLSPDLNKTLARASELLVSMNSSPNIRKSVLDLESSLKGVPSQSKYRSSMESSPVAEEKSSDSGENIQQKAAQSEENQAPAGKTEAREAAAPGKSEVPVILPPGNLKNEKIEITKRGRKWLKGKRVGKNYEIKIEINDVSRDWQAGQTVEFPAHVEVEQSKYGITTTSYPLTAEQVAQARVQAVLPDIKRWLGYVEEKAHEGHVYQNGVQKLRELGIASLPEYQKRLDAALASAKERKEAEATREVSEGRTWLRVPYADKDHAKKHGARFDGDRKQWYVIGKDVPEALEQYLPDDSGGGRPNDKRPGNGQPEQKEAGQYTISNGSGYGGSPYKTGETIRSNRKDLPEYVTVIRASQRYYGEDGMSFGVGDDSGYVYTATVREATREEAAPVRAREEAKKARKQAKEMLLSIAREIREKGDRPELQGAPAGVRIDMPGNPENIHGGGEWFVIGQDRVWHVRNNGADGDDWSANNIRTGGAGAIGFAIPFDRGLAGRLVGALEAAGADIPQAARKLTEREPVPRESRAAGGDVVATLSGEEVLWEKRKARLSPRSEAGGGEPSTDKGLSMKKSIGDQTGFVNLHVLGRAEERQTKALPESERANIEGELAASIGELQTRRLFGSMGQVKILDTQDDAQRVIASGQRDAKPSQGFALGVEDNQKISVGETPNILVALGARQLPLIVSGRILNKVTQGKHGGTLDVSALQQIHAGIYDPLAVFKSATRQNTMVIVTEVHDVNGDTVIVPVYLSTASDHHQVNAIKSIYGKRDIEKWLGDQVAAGRLLYVNTKKARTANKAAWLHLPTPVKNDGAPAVGSVPSLDSTVLTENDIVKTEVRHSKGGAIQGITMPDGQVYLVRDGIAKGQAMPVLLHELGEHAAQLGFKDMQYRAILRSMERQAKDDSETGRAIRKGIARARAAGVRPDNKYYWSEVAAYTIEENADVHTSLLDRIVNYFKGLFLKVCGVQAGKFSHKDLVMFAKAAVKAAARRGAQFGKYDPQKSLWSADESQTGLRSISEALAQREYDEVVKRYKGTAQWLKAPNGKPSNLNERQWVQVRTPSFKKWFGDWETALHLKNTATFIDQVAAGKRPADLSIGFVGGKEAGKIKQLTGVNTKGRSFKLVADDIAHALKSHGQQERESARGQVAITAEDLKLLPIVLGQPSSIVAGSTQNGRQSVRFEKKIDGTLVVVEIVPSAGSSVQFKTAWKRPSETADAFSPSHTSETDPSPPRSYNERIQQLLTQSNASVVIDANGEPLVVYHGSGEQRNIITPGMRDPGAWFTSNFRNAANYAKDDEPTIHDTFLAIRNPLVVTFDYGEDGDLVPFINGEAVDIDNNVDLVNYAQRRGYDGVHFPEGNFTEEDDTWVAFQEEQIKSATENTGDFDSENPDIRYSFAGEKGAAALDAAEETTVRIDNKGIAEDMEAAGKDAKAIKYATGWERGKDGKWRYETNDSTANFDASKIAEYGDTKLSEALDAPDLFRAYPQLRNILIKTGYNIQSAAAYNHVTNSIMVKDGVTLDKATTLHEVQHAIQEIEGFARGGNPQEFMNRAAMGKTRQGLQKKAQAESDYREAVRRFAEKHLPQYLNEWTDVDVGEGGKFSEPYNLLGQEYGSIADLAAGVADAMVEQGITPEHDLAEIFQGVPGKFQGIDGAFHEFLESEGLYAHAPGELAEIAERWREQGKAASEDLAKMTDRANEDYMSLAGESEARNVARRMNMSAEQRRNSPAEETEDVARKDQIVQKQNDGAAESREDVTSQAQDYGRRIREAAAKWASVVDQDIKDIQRNKKPSNPSSDSGYSSSRTRFQQVREQINRILPNKDEARAIIAIIEARAFSAGLTPEEFVTKRGLTFVDAELPINPQGKLLEKMMGGQLRGAFNVRDYVEEGRAIITAFRGNANVSTLAHELGHLFRQDLKRYGQDRLLAMAEHWAGVKNGRWNREQEEKFARGFEAYLLEGKAPTTAMGQVFERFRVWISRLYGALVGSQLNVGLDNEIRSVFDALLTEHAAEDAGDAFAEGIAKTRAKIAELEGSGPIDLDHRTLFQIELADSGGAGNTFTGWTSAINRIMSSHPKWRDRWERFIYNMVDTNDPRERIWKAAGSPDAQDIVTVERLRGKKAAAEQKTFRDGMVTPLLKSMAAAGLKASDLEEFAHAMHAPERNQRMREVNAKRVLESLLRQMPAKDADEYRELINLAQSGLRQGWDTTDVQRFYLDQMQKIFNDLSAREQQCNELARTATSNAAQQRVAKMQEQVAESYRIRDKWRTESQRFAGITDGEAQSIVAKWRQDKRFAAIEDARQQLSAINRATLDTLHEAGELGDEEYQALRNGYQYYVPLHRDGFQDTRPATGRMTGPTGRPFKVAKGSMLEVVNILPEVIRAHETAINRKHKLEAGRALYEFALAHPDAGITVEKQEQMPTHDREGNIVMYTRQTEPEDGVFVKVNGKRYLLRFEADVRTPEGRTLARFLDSIKGQDAQLGGITKSLHKITRLLAAVNTSLSPEFVVSNFSRDLQTALIHLNQEDINMQGLQSQVLKSVGKAVRGIWLAERGKPGNNEMARWYRDFEKNGGKVGWVQNYDGIEDLSKKLAGEMKLYEPGNRARKITRAVLDFIDAGNVAIENALRLATYKAMVEKGIDRAKAAGIASNLTVDFTRKGKLSPQINALYMFFNASVQGSYRMAKALATSPRVRKIAGGIAASGFLLQMLALAGGGDDDSDEPYVLGLPDSTRERYILIPMPGQDGRFFKFPKAYGYGALYDLGAEVANSMYMGMTGRQYNHAKGAMRVVSSFANSFNPIQSATILQTIAPTLVDPFVYVGENTNWTGLPLRPAQNNFGPKKPESGRAWKNTNPIYKSIAEGVNSLTGGDRYESGLVDISPEVFEMAVNTALGGLGRFIGNTAALPLATAKGELDAEKIPFVRQVYAKWDDRALSNRYYEAMERAQIARMRFKNAETLAEKRSIFDSPEYKIWRQSNATDKQVKRLRARLNRMEAAGNTVGADYLRKQIVGLQSKVLSTIM